MLPDGSVTGAPAAPVSPGAVGIEVPGVVGSLVGVGPGELGDAEVLGEPVTGVVGVGPVLMPGPVLDAGDDGVTVGSVG